MKALLLYDNECRVCINIVSVLSVLNRCLQRSNKSIQFVPIQEYAQNRTKNILSKSELLTEVHLIDNKNRLYKGADAIAQLSQFFPELTFFLMIFKIDIGKRLYTWIAKNRYKVLNCNSKCHSR